MLSELKNIYFYYSVSVHHLCMGLQAHKIEDIYNIFTVFLSEIDIIDFCKNFYATHYFASQNHPKHQFSYK